MTQILKINNLHYTYKNQTASALSGMNFSLHSGESVGILGPNGAGKTTLISIICGQIPISQQHSVLIFDKQPNELDQRKLDIGLCPQHLAFYPYLTVIENLKLFASLLHLSKNKQQSRIDYVLNFVDLQTQSHKAVEQLSGGMKRKLNLAISLLGKPQLLILDEPTVGIDTESRNFMLQKLLSLKNSGVAIIYTSHYLVEIEQICDKILLLDQGLTKFNGNLNEFNATFKSNNLESAFLNSLKNKEEPS